MTTCTTTKDTIELSLGRINLNGDETLYTPSVQKTADLQRVFTSHNYSPIIWDKNSRLSDNFLHATGFCVDNDHGLTIEQARGKLKNLNLNYALITTKSHTPGAHRFRIFIPFNRKVHSLTDYSRIVNKLTSNHFPTSDPKVKDGARQLFASPKDAQFEACWTGHDYDVDMRVDSNERMEIADSWTDKLWVKDKKDRLIRACDWITRNPELKGRISTYHWKHEVENWLRTDGIKPDYIAQGVFILAAYHLGYKIHRIRGDLGARIGKKEVKS